MKRAEYEALIQQREEIRNKLERLGWIIEEILDGMDIKNSGKVKIIRLEGGLAEVEYLKPGCHSSCCGEEFGYINLPVAWVFGEVDWKAENAHVKEVEAATKKQLEQEAQEKERLAQEERDREEFERLKSKFEPKLEPGKEPV